MSLFNQYGLLEIVESFATENDSPYADEEMVSMVFNVHILPAIVEQYGADDEVAINEAFNNWTDGLCKDGEIHDEQYNSYCYLGEDT